MDNNLKRTRERHQKYRYAAPFGGLFLLLAAIGLVAVAVMSVHLTAAIMDNTKEKQKFESFILPVLMFDPVTFESPADADPEMVLKSSLWAALLDNRTKYTYDESGMLVVPVSDVDVYAARLFGSDIKVEHKSILSFEMNYVYNEEQNTYSVPADGQVWQYKPRVQKITKKGNTYTLLVDYIPPGSLWETDFEGNTYEPEPDKTMIYELKKVKNGYNIVAIRESGEQLDLSASSGSSGADGEAESSSGSDAA
ncbi:MAG: hypothetical protein SOX72_03290 [Oscillospiraceae bacterium]|nr:hypothetical protein [Oscillospiraceae bacterium]MDY4191222.1 hypothetical protein [Oscillospiraceae bacterium]